MIDEPFIDTNILCYAYDLSEPTKRRVCKQIVEKVFSGENKGVVSIQVLVELYNALTQKLGVEIDSARIIVESIIASENWLKIRYDENSIKSALRSSSAFDSSFLDTLIAETMKENGVSQIITENVKDFKRIPGIKISNPME